jgi:crossover junction endodeoxyribonuclease RusA
MSEGGGPLTIELSWPAKELSPNVSVHHMKLYRFKKAAKTEAGWATKIAVRSDWQPSGERVKVRLIAHPPTGTVQPDDDNMVARVKAHIDGIADALGVNDNTFEAPTITWAERTQRGKLFVELS